MGKIKTILANKKIWKLGIQTVINILAAMLTALGATSCMRG